MVYVAKIDCPGAVPDSQGVFIASLDWDGDRVPDFLDNCPLVLNADQNNTDKALAAAGANVVADNLGNACDPDIDGDGASNDQDACPTTLTPWPTPAGDTDCDGWTADDENFMGTNPDLACGIAAWPPDFNNSNDVDIFDINILKPVFFTMAPGPPYNARFDLRPDNTIDIFDINRLKPTFFLSCTP